MGSPGSSDSLNEQAPPPPAPRSSIPDPSAAAAGPACTLAIGPEFPPTGSSLTVAPGETVVIIATCAPGVTVVDLVVSAPPPQGVMLILATERLRETPAGVLWRWAGEMADAAAGLTLTFYGYADGLPAGEPVTLTVEEG